MPDKFAPDMPISDLPIVIGYIPVSFAFGLNAGMSLWISALSVMAMDIRHILYHSAHFLFRYLPLRLEANRLAVRKTGMMFESISSLLIVSNMPDVMKQYDKLFPTLIGYLTIFLAFNKARTTLSGAVAFGIIFKVFMN